VHVERVEARVELRGHVAVGDSGVNGARALEGGGPRIDGRGAHCDGAEAEPAVATVERVAARASYRVEVRRGDGRRGGEVRALGGWHGGSVANAEEGARARARLLLLLCVEVAHSCCVAGVCAVARGCKRLGRSWGRAVGPKAVRQALRARRGEDVTGVFGGAFALLLRRGRHESVGKGEGQALHRGREHCLLRALPHGCVKARSAEQKWVEAVEALHHELLCGEVEEGVVLSGLVCRRRTRRAGTMAVGEMVNTWLVLMVEPTGASAAAKSAPAPCGPASLVFFPLALDFWSFALIFEAPLAAPAFSAQTAPSLTLSPLRSRARPSLAGICAATMWSG